MSDSSEEIFANILKPGSFLHPTFLAILDAIFLLLFLLFIALAFVTSGNFHIFALMAIELGLWASVKWFVEEYKKIKTEEAGQNDQRKEE
ncbi:hypothetical protein K443DRAFT_86657 [Laccaria amethystina LaAM-08-1]|uniref:V-type ATPase assembly factor PKR1 n=1 Tax=Laccaria amethystina LaAM-08-1 TaxID=1095629 RepID=A0A0C9X5Z9_9AGAR|nr:hypothetical protein K443DRAFT_86657 [Laccaria amethystina LaAM-08-1]